MKKAKKAGRIIFLCVTKFTLILVMIGIILAYPMAKLLMGKGGNSLSEKFFGKKAEYQGILRLWNIDSFEGGNMPKSSYLEKMCMQFEKKYKGVFIKVENLSEDELVANLKMGLLPDLVSFGTGMNRYFEGKFIALDDSIAINLLPNFYGAGLSSGSLKACAYMTGAYSLISTSERLEKLIIDTGAKLSSLAFALTENIETKKGTKHINSLTFGGNDYVNAIEVFNRKFKQNAYSLSQDGVLDSKYNSQSSFEAYESFVTKKSNMLLGTQRDVFRMENRLSAGKEIDVLYEPLNLYTDLVQYIGILNPDQKVYNTSSLFIEYLLSSAAQSQLSSIGMFSVLGLKLYEEGALCELEKAINENMVVKSAF